MITRLHSVLAQLLLPNTCGLSQDMHETTVSGYYQTCSYVHLDITLMGELYNVTIFTVPSHISKFDNHGTMKPVQVR